MWIYGIKRSREMTKHEAAVISAYTGYMIGNFGDMQDYAEKALGRSIFTHEFARKDICEELKQAAKADLMNIHVGA
jgi:hypothetical protein